MPEHERIVTVAREWVLKAENDLKNEGALNPRMVQEDTSLRIAPLKPIKLPRE